MSQYHIAKLTEQFEKFLDVFERLDTFNLHECINREEEAAVDATTVIELRRVLEAVMAKRAYLTSEDLARMFNLFTQALK